MNKFEEYYNSEIKKYGGVKNYVTGKSKEKKPLLDRIMKYSKNNKTILEAGCGSAANSIFLANNQRKVTCLDKDNKMLELAKKNSKNFYNKPLFMNKNISELENKDGNFDVSFSHGVLEHYRDKEIINLINKQLKVAKHIIISIPSNFFRQEQAINGDERFMSKNKWKQLIRKTNGTLAEDFAYFYDSDELKIVFLRNLAKLSFNLLPLKKPYLGFVVKRN